MVAVNLAPTRQGIIHFPQLLDYNSFQFGLPFDRVRFRLEAVSQLPLRRRRASCLLNQQAVSTCLQHVAEEGGRRPAAGLDLDW